MHVAGNVFSYIFPWLYFIGGKFWVVPAAQGHSKFPGASKCSGTNYERFKSMTFKITSAVAQTNEKKNYSTIHCNELNYDMCLNTDYVFKTKISSNPFACFALWNLSGSA